MIKFVKSFLKLAELLLFVIRPKKPKLILLKYFHFIEMLNHFVHATFFDEKRFINCWEIFHAIWTVFFSETIAKSLKGSKNFQGFALIRRQDYLLLFYDKKNYLTVFRSNSIKWVFLIFLRNFLKISLFALESTDQKLLDFSFTWERSKMFCPRGTHSILFDNEAEGAFRNL